jgi:nitroimidazol reductase NimA-like FMN-containing flavoprotein (pyridoxamine 5'-phosphate oxidase superfamily)
MLKKIAALVKSQGHLVLATCAQAEPHTSLMSFAAAPGTPESGGEFWLATQTDTRKYANLQANPQASLLLDDRSGQGQGSALGEPSLALTVVARYVPFDTTEQEGQARQALLHRHPGLKSFLDRPEVLVIRFVATRYQLLEGLTQTFVHESAKNP